jgi:hypothetical protein
MKRTRLLRWGVTIAALALTGVVVAGSKAEAKKPPPQVTAYVLGSLDGPLAKALQEVLQPAQWKGQTDGLVIMAGKAVHRLTSKEENGLRAVHAHHQPIVVTNASQGHVDGLNNVLGIPRTVGLRAPYDHFDYYAYVHSGFSRRTLEIMPITSVASRRVAAGRVDAAQETDEHKQQRAQELLRWIEQDGRPNSVGQPSGLTRPASPAQASSCDTSGCQEIYGVIDATVQKEAIFSVNYEWGECSGRNDQTTNYCTIDYQVFLNAWPVYSQTHAQGGNAPTDYFIVQIQSNLNVSKCWNFYSGDNANRIAAYWARTYTFTAKTQDTFSFDELQIDPEYNPKAANPTISVQTGTTWNISGTGTIGAGPEGPTGSVGFSAGVSYTDQTTAAYAAMTTVPGIGNTPNTAPWTYDSWNYVHPAIEPSNHACPSGLNTSLLTNAVELTTGTFSPQETFVWMAYPTVRNTYAGGSLPVNLDLDVLLGWVYYPNGVSQCGFSSELYDLPDNPSSAHVTNATYGIQGLTFDVSCATVTTYGTMPLGPFDESSQDNSDGNPGNPKMLSMTTTYIPFAPVPQ